MKDIRGYWAHYAVFLGNIVLGLFLIYAMFYWVNEKRNSSTMDETKAAKVDVSASLLKSYLPPDWKLAKSKVVFLHKDSVDVLWVKRLEDALTNRSCELSSMKVVLLVRKGQTIRDEGVLPHSSWLSIAYVNEIDQAALCSNCGFTAVLNLVNNEVKSIDMSVDPYAICDWVLRE